VSARRFPAQIRLTLDSEIPKRSAIVKSAAPFSRSLRISVTLGGEEWDFNPVREHPAMVAFDGQPV
jgi:hypothetical protein